MSVSEWSSHCARVKRTIVSRSYAALTDTTCNSPPHAITNCDVCHIELSEVCITPATDGRVSPCSPDVDVSQWLAAGDGVDAEPISRRVQIDTAETTVDALLEQCLLTMSVGDTAQLTLSPRLPDDGAVMTCRLAVVTAGGGVCWTERSSAAILDWCRQRCERGRQLMCAGLVSAAVRQYCGCVRLLLYALTRRKCRPSSAPSKSATSHATHHNAAAIERSDDCNSDNCNVDADAAVLQQLTEQLTLCQANVSACRVQQRQWERATTSATLVLATQPQHVKCVFRRATARLHLNQLPEAAVDIAELRQLQPSGSRLIEQLTQQLNERQLRADHHTASFMRKFLSG